MTIDSTTILIICKDLMNILNKKSPPSYAKKTIIFLKKDGRLYDLSRYHLSCFVRISNRYKNIRRKNGNETTFTDSALVFQQAISVYPMITEEAGLPLTQQSPCCRIATRPGPTPNEFGTRLLVLFFEYVLVLVYRDCHN